MLGTSSLFGQPVKVPPHPTPYMLPGSGNRRFKTVSQTQMLSSQKPIFTSLDIDGTLIPWVNEPEADEVALMRYQRTLQNPALKPKNLVMLNTGRGLTATKYLSAILARTPVDVLGLNDGQQLYLRPPASYQGQDPVTASHQWLQSLSGKDEDKDWKAQLKGWSAVEVLADLRRELTTKALGFQPAAKPGQKNRYNPTGLYYAYKKPVCPRSPEKGDWVIRVRPDQSFFEVDCTEKGATPSQIAAYGEFLTSLLQDTLEAKWDKTYFYTSSSPDRCYIHLGPAGNSKAALVNYLIGTRHDTPPQAVISAGDSNNDIEILSSKTLGGVPNYPILVNGSARLKAALAKNAPPTLERVGWNKLDEGLEKQFAKILPLLKQEAADEESDKASKHTPKLDKQA